MLSKIPGEILLALMIGLFALAVVVVVGGTIWALLRAKKSKAKNRTKVVLLSLLCVAIAAASWLLNMGWIRFFMTIMLIPFVHAIIFFVTNVWMAAFTEKDNYMKWMNILFCITYLLFYLFLPDAADTGEQYLLFGLVHSDVISGIAFTISGLAISCNGLLLVVQIVEMIRKKKSLTEETL